MRQRVTQLAAFVDGAGNFGRDMAGDAARPGELAKELLHAVAVEFNGRIAFGVGAFQIRVRHDTWPAMARAHDVHHVQAVLFDQPIQMHINQVQSWHGAPMPQQAWFHVR